MRVRYIAAWLLLLVTAFVNGALRELLFQERLGEHRAHQLSTLIGLILFGLVIWSFLRRWPLRSRAEAITVGLVWLAMTVAFEFLFFHYVDGKPWNELLEAYDILGGNLWPLILVWVAVAPALFHQLGTRRES